MAGQYLTEFEVGGKKTTNGRKGVIYRVILSVLDPRKSEYLKDYSSDFERAYMTTYLAS
jgi:hypothetical protein